MPFIQPTGFTGHLAFAIAATVFGSSFQHGYNTGVVNAPQAIIEKFINESNFVRNGEYLSDGSITIIWAIAVSIYCVGGMVGALCTGLLADRFGRKGALLLNNISILIGAILMGFSKLANSYEMIIIGRFFVGVNSGLNAGLAPMYLAEISPAHLRGAIGTSYQLVVTVAILIAQILGLPGCLGSEERWPILLAMTIVPGIFQLATLPLCPESPKYMLLNLGKDIEAQKALTWLRGTIEIHDELDEMKAEADELKSVPKVTLKEMLTNPLLRMPLTISIVVMLSQQLSGINAVIFFSTEIFKSAGLTDEVSLYATLGMGTINVIMTFVSLILVERAGRRSLHLAGLAGVFVSTVLLTICLAIKHLGDWISYLCIAWVFLFIIMFASGPGSIPWFLVAELFGQGARSMATSIAVGINWGANFIVGLGFLPLTKALGEYTFLVFATLLAIFWIFTYKNVPETKNKTTEDIAAIFRQRVNKSAY